MGRPSTPAADRDQQEAGYSIGVCVLLGPGALSGLRPALAMFVRRGDKGGEQRVRFQWLRLEFGMELAAEKPGMIGYFANLDVHRIRRLPGNAESAGRQNLLVLAIEFVTVAMALADLGLAVGLAREAAFRQQARVSAQAHGAAQLVHAFQLAQLVNHAVGRRGIELRRIGMLQPADVARKLDNHGLHSETDSEIRNFAFARIANGGDHTLDAAL